MKRNTDMEATIVGKSVVMAPLLDERARRLWATRSRPRSAMAVTRSCRRRRDSPARQFGTGVENWRWAWTPPGEFVVPGAGRPDIEQTQPGVTEAVDLLIEPLTRGDPMSLLRWTCKSRAKLAAALTAQGWRVSSTTFGHLPHALGYRLQALRKTQEGTSHPDRNAQFEHINTTAAGGRDHDTPAFAVASIRQWWTMMGRAAYAHADALFITADAGGSNSYRSRASKHELQRLADDVHLRIHVSHFPPGTSKWNKIEHRRDQS